MILGSQHPQPLLSPRAPDDVPPKHFLTMGALTFYGASDGRQGKTKAKKISLHRATSRFTHNHLQTSRQAKILATFTTPQKKHPEGWVGEPETQPRQGSTL